MVIGLQCDHTPKDCLHLVGLPQFFSRQGLFVQQVHIVGRFLDGGNQQRIGFLLAPAFAQQLQFRLQFGARLVRIVLGKIAYQGERFFQAALLGKHHGAANLHTRDVLGTVDARKNALGFRKIALLFCNLRQQQIGLHDAAGREAVLIRVLLRAALRQYCKVAAQRLLGQLEVLILKFNRAT